VGHQYSTTGQKYLDWLTQNGQEDSENYRLASENIEQGKQFYEAGDLVYREEKMVDNFKREIAGVDGESVMGIYGGAHLGGTVSGTDIPAMASQLKELYEKEYHGILLLATEMTQEDFLPFQNLPCPLVALDCYYEDMNFDTVLINNVQGSYMATSHLIQKGFVRIGYLKSSFPIANFRERADGYFKALRSNNIKKNMDYVLELYLCLSCKKSGNRTSEYSYKRT